MGRFPFKLITFDVNGTILKPKGKIGQTYADFARRRGLSVDPEALEQKFRTTFKSMNEKHPNFGQKSGLGWRTWWKNVVNESFHLVIGPVNDDESQQISCVADDLICFFSTGESWELETGSLRVLDRLKSNCIDLGIVSNTDPRLHNVIDDIGCSKYFHFILTSYEVKAAKPLPEIFNAARELYCGRTSSLVDGSSILHIGNSYSLDYLGAKNAGFQSILVNCKERFDDECCISLKNLMELDNHLIKIGCK